MELGYYTGLTQSSGYKERKYNIIIIIIIIIIVENNYNNCNIHVIISRIIWDNSALCQVAGLDDVLSLLKRVTYTINNITMTTKHTHTSF